MFDYHIHSTFSIDSKEDPRHILTAAREHGIKHLAITDHMDPYPTEHPHEASFPIADYFKTWEALLEDFSDLDVSIGMELGLQEGLGPSNDALVAACDFDVVLGSIHAVEGEDAVMGSFLKRYTPADAMMRYFEATRASILEHENFHVLGHLDYLERYLPKDSPLPPASTYEEIVREIFSLLIKKGKGIEINTGGHRRGLPEFHPKTHYLKIYRELGGEILTIGSDAHFAKDVGSYAKEAMALAKSLGFSTITTFKKGQPIFHAI